MSRITNRLRDSASFRNQPREPHDPEFEARQPVKKFAKVPNLGSPSKRRQLDDDGLVMLDVEGETVDNEDDIIVLD